MAALFNFPNCEQDLLQLDKVPFEVIWLGTIQVSQRDLTGALPVINIFEKLLPCETCVFCQTCGIHSALFYLNISDEQFQLVVFTFQCNII